MRHLFPFKCTHTHTHITKALRYKLFSVKAYQNDYRNYDDYDKMINRD